MILPAFCTQCGQVVSSGISASNSVNIETVNNYIIYESTQENEIREQQILPKAKTGRNELCPCGSGKKYKFCCYEQDRSQNK